MKRLFAWLTGPTGVDIPEPLETLLRTRWVSDRSGTHAWLAQHRQDLAQREDFVNRFGQMTCTFTTTTFTTHLAGQVHSRPYKLLGQTAREIALQIFDHSQKRDVIVVIEIDLYRQGYWVYVSEFDVKEHFVPQIGDRS